MPAMRFLPFASVAFALLAALPVRADDSNSITTKLGNAAAAVKSFVLQMRVTGTTGVNGTLTFVRPLKLKSEFTMGPMSVETYLVDGMLYVYSVAAGWQKMPLDAVHAPQQSVNIAESLKSSKVTLLPDRQEDGATVGVIQIDAQLPPSVGALTQQPAQQMVCSYDKASYFLHICTNSLMTMTYTKYNDPANTIVLPADAKNAVSAPIVPTPMAPMPMSPTPISPAPASPTPVSPAPFSPAAAASPLSRAASDQ